LFFFTYHRHANSSRLLYAIIYIVRVRYLTDTVACSGTMSGHGSIHLWKLYRDTWLQSHSLQASALYLRKREKILFTKTFVASKQRNRWFHDVCIPASPPVRANYSSYRSKGRGGGEMRKQPTLSATSTQRAPSLSKN